MNTSEHCEEKDQLDIILKERPNFIIRWGLVVFIVIIFSLLLFTHYTGYDIMPYWQR
jgi:hypothetical protein